MSRTQLQSLDPAAWTDLLNRAPLTVPATVKRVQVESVDGSLTLRRYWLELDGYSDPLTLLGKSTTVTEANAYSTFGTDLLGVMPYCWFSDILGETGWVVLSDVPGDRPVSAWCEAEMDDMVKALARLHAAYFNQSGFLRQYPWIPHYLDLETESKLALVTTRQDSIISTHAIERTGRFAPRLMAAASGLRALRALGELPGIFDHRHLQAAADLLDDPVPMMQPLRELPATLLHGQAATTHWQISLFDDVTLLDWTHVLIGPSPYDLIVLLESYEMQRTLRQGWRNRSERLLFEETAIDGYLLHMDAELDQEFPARATRRAIASARCLFILSSWFPRFATWFEHIPAKRESRAAAGSSVSETGQRHFDQLKPHLSNLFYRFLQAYRTL